MKRQVRIRRIRLRTAENVSTVNLPQLGQEWNTLSLSSEEHRRVVEANWTLWLPILHLLGNQNV